MPSPLLQDPPQLLDLDLAFSQIGDRDAMRDMLVLLQESLARDVPEISRALRADEITQASRLLHALKGFIPIFCQAMLCEQVTQVEGLSKEARGAELLPAYAALRPQLETLCAEVSAYLASPAGQA